MKVRELQEILKDYHPDEEVGLRSESHRNMTFLGVDYDAIRELGHLVLTVDFTIKDKPVESVRDKLERQGEAIRQAIERIDREEAEGAAKKIRKKNKNKRSTTELLLNGYIPSGKPGRPRKIVTEEELDKPKGKRGRPRKEPDSSQDFSQSDEISIADCIL